MEAVKKLINSKTPFKSIFAANDLIALGAMKAITQRGLKIPDDVTIVGYDDISTCSIVNPSLTTIRQPTYLMRTKAAQLILNQLSNKFIEKKHILLEPELVVRETV